MRRLNGKWRPDYAHRAAYEFLVGPIERGVELDHECLNKICVRPGAGHVVPVTSKENRLRQFRTSLRRTKTGQYASLEAME